MFRYVFIFCILLIPGISPAQEELADTIQLNDVIIYGLPIQKFSTGYKTQTFDSSKLDIFDQQSVGEFLTRKTPVFFRSYGNGMASTISFRGTGPSHTAVLWNGLAINHGEQDHLVLPPGSGSPGRRLPEGWTTAPFEPSMADNSTE